MGNGDEFRERALARASLWQWFWIWWRLKLGAYHGLRTELPAFYEEFIELKSRPGAAGGAWAASVAELLETAVKVLRDEPEIAWKCYKTATRMALLAFEGEDAANRVEIVNQAREVLKEANEKLKSWRGDAIRQILSDEHGAIRGNLEARSLLRARRLLDEYNDNLYRKLKVLRKRLRILELGGIAVAAVWIALYPGLGLPADPSSPVPAPGSVASAVALVGLAGAIASGFSASKSLSGSRVPLQEAELAIMIGRLVFGTLAALAVVSFVASGIMNLGPKTVPGALAVAFASGFTERLVVTAVNSFGGKEQS